MAEKPKDGYEQIPDSKKNHLGKAAIDANIYNPADAELDRLKDPQATVFYGEAEGFHEMLSDPEHDYAKGMQHVRGNGVENNPDGSYTLKYEETSHLINPDGTEKT